MSSASSAKRGTPALPVLVCIPCSCCMKLAGSSGSFSWPRFSMSSTAEVTSISRFPHATSHISARTWPLSIYMYAQRLVPVALLVSRAHVRTRLEVLVHRISGCVFLYPTQMTPMRKLVCGTPTIATTFLCNAHTKFGSLQLIYGTRRIYRSRGGAIAFGDPS